MKSTVLEKENKIEETSELRDLLFKTFRALSLVYPQEAEDIFKRLTDFLISL